MARKQTAADSAASSRKTTTRQTTEARSSKTRGGTGSRGRSSTPQKGPIARSSPRSGSRSAGLSLNVRQKALIGGIGIIFVTAVLVLSLLSPNQGQLTAALSGLMWRTFGWGGLIMPIVTAVSGLYLVLWGMEQPPQLPIYRLAGFGVLFLTFEAFASMSALMSDNGLSDVWTVARAESGGGYLGGLITYTLTQFVGRFGAIFTLVVVGVMGAILVTGITRAEMGRLLAHLFYSLRRLLSGVTAAPAVPEAPGRPPIRLNPARQPEDASRPVQLPLLPNAPPKANKEPSKLLPDKAKPVRERPLGSAASQTLRPAKPAATPPAAAAPTAVAQPIFLGHTRVSKSGSWTLPVLADMLESGSDPSLNNSAIQRQVEIIEHTLESFGAPATTVEINQGPTVTQFGVEPKYLEMRNGKRTKVKVSKITSLADDLALALAAESIRIEAPVPGKGYIGIEVPNPAKALVSLRDVMESREYQKIKSSLRIGLGQNVSGQSVAADLAAMPHLLVAGTTGSGKSVCVNGIITCLLLQNSPDDLKLVMVDPKRVELTGYNGIPHLAAPVVVEMDRVIGTLQWALREMENRYKLFAQVAARNIKDYNQKIASNKEADKLPYIVIIIDELADLMMMAPEDTERSVARLAQMARATGIHMIIATQRPSVDVVTGLIKANFPARIAFAVASSIDSRVILDTVGAERLLGQGDMLFQSPDAATPVRLQGCFVSDAELTRLINYWHTARRFNLIPVEPQAILKPEELAQKMAARRAEAPAAEQKTQMAAAKPAVPTGQPKREVPKTAVSAPPHETPRPQVSALSENKRAVAKTAVASPPALKETPTIVQQPLWEALEQLGDESDSGHDDELLPEAVALVRKLNKASTSLLQRRFRIGYTRAARLIDYMEEQGIIGPATGTSKARDVLSESGAEGQELAEAEIEAEELEGDEE